MGDELTDFLFRHFFGMLLVVEEDKPADPTHIGAFGAEAKMPHPGNISDLFEKFWRWHRADLSYGTND